MTMGHGSRVTSHGKLLLLLVACACAEYTPPLQIEPPVVRPDGVVAYLVASQGPGPNEYTVRAVAKHGVAVEDPGSFVAALSLPSRNVMFLADASAGDAARAVAVNGNAVRVAGAAPAGLATGELFAVRLRASRANDVNGLTLEVSELSDRSGISLRPKLVVLDHVSWIGRR